jgi:hypothetical protein
VGVFNRFVIQWLVFEDAELSAVMYAACKESARAFESFGVWTSGRATVTRWEIQSYLPAYGAR